MKVRRYSRFLSSLTLKLVNGASLFYCLDDEVALLIHDIVENEFVKKALKSNYRDIGLLLNCKRSNSKVFMFIYKRPKSIRIYYIYNESMMFFQEFKNAGDVEIKVLDYYNFDSNKWE